MRHQVALAVLVSGKHLMKTHHQTAVNLHSQQLTLEAKNTGNLNDARICRIRHNAERCWCRHIRAHTCEIGVIEHIEELSAHLQSDALGKDESLYQRRIPRVRSGKK